MPDTRARISTSFEPSVRPTASSTMGAELISTVRVVTGIGFSRFVSALPPQAVSPMAPESRRTDPMNWALGRNMRALSCSGARSVAAATRVFSAFPRGSDVRAERQIAQSAAAGGEDCVGERGSGGRQADFACASRVTLAVDDRHFDVRCVGDAQKWVVVEVALHDLTFLDGNFQVARRADAVDRAAHHLCFEPKAVDRPANVDSADAALDSIAAVAGNTHFHRVRGVTAESEMSGDAESATLRDAASPANTLSGEAQYVGESTGIERRSAVLSVGQLARRAEQAKSESERVLLRGVCDLVDKTLHGERVRGMRGRAP